MAKDWIHGEKRISWSWILRDFFFRILLYLLIPFVVIGLHAYPLRSMGFIWPTLPQLIAALVLSVISFWVCLWFRSRSKKKRLLNPTQDFWFSIYSFFINASVEEFFFRGFILSITTSLSNSLFLGLVISSLLFGFQHYLFFGASFPTILFDSAGGFLLGLLYILLGKSLIPVILVHGTSNLAIFTVGNYILQKGELKKNETNCCR